MTGEGLSEAFEWIVDKALKRKKT